MKNFFIFLSGFICGTVLLFVITKTTTLLTNKSDDLVMFEKDGECFDTDELVVFQALEKGMALAQFGGSSDGAEVLLRILAGPTVLLLDEKYKKSFYDGEVISIPEGMCARQVGTYRYETQSGTFSTLPVVAIRLSKN